jgi:hypothetical protein
MGVPTYLTVSRHNVYYLRWPLPQSLHPLGKASDIKVSLRTRDQREALRLSRYLAYVAETLTTRAVTSEMRYDEIRTVITRHFKTLLDKKIEQIGAHGRLSKYDLSVLASSQAVAEMPVGEELYERATPKIEMTFYGAYRCSTGCPWIKGRKVTRCSRPSSSVATAIT